VEELEALGAEEYFYGSGICLVEWAERAGGLLPARRWEVVLEYATENERRIAVRWLESGAPRVC
jgi:tRNA threonylcarbamoyladenosine biosynthesis protein TsaE